MIDEKKKFESRYGQIEICKTHKWSKAINGFLVTPYFQELQVYGGQSDNYTASVSQIEKYLRITVNRSQMERVTKCYGQEISEQMEEVGTVQLNQTVHLKKRLIEKGNAYCMVDGCMILTREGETSNDWKEVKLGRIFTDRDHFEVDKHHNWINESIYLAHLGDYEEFLKKFEPIVDVLDSLKERLVFVADGAPWIWNWIENAYGDAIQILDFYHAIEHLAGFAKVHFKSKKQAKIWLSAQKIRLLNDQIEQVIEGITTMEIKSKKVEKKRKSLLTYLKNNQTRMLYKTFRDQGLAIGSGAIESAHRTVIQKRLKQSGQRWTIDGAQKIMDLRVVNASKQWHRVVDIIKDEEIKLFNKAA